MTQQVTLHLLATEQVQVGRYDKRDETLSWYEVRLDGTPIGGVARQMITRERRTPGRRYVNARWQSPGWTYSKRSGRYAGGFQCSGRRDGVERLLGDAGVGWSDRDRLAKAAKVARTKDAS